MIDPNRIVRPKALAGRDALNLYLYNDLCRVALSGVDRGVDLEQFAVELAAKVVRDAASEGRADLAPEQLRTVASTLSRRDSTAAAQVMALQAFLRREAMRLGACQ